MNTEIESNLKLLGSKQSELLNKMAFDNFKIKEVFTFRENVAWFLVDEKGRNCEEIKCSLFFSLLERKVFCKNRLFRSIAFEMNEYELSDAAISSLKKISEKKQETCRQVLGG